MLQCIVSNRSLHIRLWLEDTDEFRSWIDDSNSSMFWLSGILGSGKTVMTASVIDRLLIDKTVNKSVRFFFCQHDNESSLKAETVLHSIARQSLTVENFSDCLKPFMSKLLEGESMDKEELKEFLLETISSSPIPPIIVVDGFDEMISEERYKVLWVLQRLSYARTGVKLFLSSRTDVEADIKLHFSATFHNINMERREVGQDIANYIQAALEERRKMPPGCHGRLVVSESSMLEEIEEALTKGAQGMYVWKPPTVRLC